MKQYFILMMVTILLVLPACERTEETVDRIDDAFDLDPYDKIHDAAEDISEGIQDFITETQEEAEDFSE